MEITGKKAQRRKNTAVAKAWLPSPVMFLVVIMSLPAKGRAKPLKCSPVSWGENYSYKILKSQLKAFDEYMLRHKEIFKILYLQYTSAFPFYLPIFTKLREGRLLL